MKRTPIIAYTIIFSLFCSCAAKKVSVKEAAYRPWGMIGAKIGDGYNGITVTQVIAHSPAKKAGLKEHDFIRTVAGKRALSTSKLINFIRSRLPDTIISIGIERNGITQQLRIKIGRFPQAKQLLIMAKAAARSFDFARALQLIKEIENRWGNSKTAQQAKRLKKKVVNRLK